jgi:hypothetical protein
LRTRGRGGKREKTSDILSESCSSHIPLRIAPTNNLVIGPVVACALHLSRQTIELRGSAAPRNGASCVLQFASLAAVLPSLPPPGGRSILLPFPKPISFLEQCLSTLLIWIVGSASMLQLRGGWLHWQDGWTGTKQSVACPVPVKSSAIGIGATG